MSAAAAGRPGILMKSRGCRSAVVTKTPDVKDVLNFRFPQVGSLMKLFAGVV